MVSAKFEVTGSSPPLNLNAILLGGNSPFAYQACSWQCKLLFLLQLLILNLAFAVLLTSIHYAVVCIIYHIYRHINVLFNTCLTSIYYAVV